jgi:hypothetical protein
MSTNPTDSLGGRTKAVIAHQEHPPVVPATRGICKNRAPKCQIVDHAGLAVSPEDLSWTTRRDLRRGGYQAHEPLLRRVSTVVVT